LFIVYVYSGILTESHKGPTDRQMPTANSHACVRFRRGRKFVVLVVGGRAASWWPLDFHLRVRRQ